MRACAKLTPERLWTPTRKVCEICGLALSPVRGSLHREAIRSAQDRGRTRPVFLVVPYLGEFQSLTLRTERWPQHRPKRQIITHWSGPWPKPYSFGLERAFLPIRCDRHRNGTSPRQAGYGDFALPLAIPGDYYIIPRNAFTTRAPMPIGIMYFHPMSINWS